MPTSGNHHLWLMRTAAIVAVLFGAATIRAGGSVLFGDGAQTAGKVIGFVLWFNFLAGFAYVVAGAGLWMRTRWSAPLALAIAAGTVLMFGAFGICVAAGGPFEARTAWAMTLRSSVWIVIALFAHRVVNSNVSPPASGEAASGEHGIASAAK